ncbi:MAG: aminopeptidase P family protein [Odoribacter splanchnicus]|nr:aminopeptidase P family protein [Odoribacter splanchnicus]
MEITFCKEKLEKIQQQMQLSGADACLLCVDVNLYYLTGRIYNGYFYIPAEGEPYFFVKRPAGFSGENVYYIRKPEDITGILSAAAMELPEYLWLETDVLSYNESIRLEKIFRPARLGDAGKLMRNIRKVKTAEEIEQFRISAQRHVEVYKEVRECFRMGMTDLQLQYEIEYRMRKMGSLGLFRAYGSNMDVFMGSLLAGKNAEAPSPFDFALGGQGEHSIYPLGACGVVLEEGMAVMVDMAGNYTPYMTDMTRVFSVGRLADEAYRAHRVSLDIHERVMEMARPGTACADLYREAVDIAEKAGLSDCFMGTQQQAKFIGHGVGLQINELPVLTPRSQEVLEPGMVFALEPKFVIPGTGAVGIENTLLVTDSGVENLTVFEEDIIPLM